MAITRTAKGTATSKTSGTTLTISSVAMTTGHLLVVSLAYDDETLNSVTWGSETLTLGDAVLGAGVRTRLAWKTITSGGTQTITATWANALVAKAMTASSYSSDTGGAVPNDDSNATATGKSTTPSTAAVSPAIVGGTDSVLVGVVGTEGPSDDSAGTWSVPATDGQRVGTTGNPANGNVTVSEAYTIAPSAASTPALSKSGITNRDWGAGIRAFYWAAAGTNAPAGHASGTGTSQAPTAALTTNAGHSSGTGAAHDATVSVGIDAQAGHASGTGTAYDASTAITFDAGHASGTGATGTALAGSGPLAEAATGTGAAQDATTAQTASAGHASGTGSAETPSVSITVNAEQSTGTGTSYDATVSTVAATNAPAGHASGTGTAYDGTVALTVAAGNAAGTGAAQDASLAVTVGAGQATGTGSAPDAVAALTVAAGHSSGTGTSYDATVTTSGNTEAPAEVATGTGSAGGITSALGINAEAATAIAVAYDATGALAALAGLPSGTGTAYDATVSVAGGSVSADAGHASGTGTAYDATILAPSAGGGITGKQPAGARRLLIPSSQLIRIREDDDEDRVDDLEWIAELLL